MTRRGQGEVGMVLGIIVVGLALMFGLTWLASGNNLALYKYFGPRTEAVRRQVFEQSKAYNTGMIQELQNMEFQYLRTTDRDAKAALASIILHRVSDYNNDSLPPDLRSFIEHLRTETTQ